MELINCSKKCCLLKKIEYNSPTNYSHKNHNRKAGIFIYDPNSNKILLVQSRGRLWGPPKGTAENNETDMECALREVKEETGLDIDMNHITKSVTLKNKATYFYIEMNYKELHIPINNIENNDVTGIGWIFPECLVDSINRQTINVTTHCKILLRKFLNIEI